MSAPTLCVAALLVDGERVALIRSSKPGRAWELPGGKVGPGETWQQALSREVREETGLVVAPNAWRLVDVPAGKPTPGAQFPSTIIAARADARGELQAGDDAAEAAWWPRTGLPEELSALQSRDVLFAWNAERPPKYVSREDLAAIVERAPGPGEHLLWCLAMEVRAHRADRFHMLSDAVRDQRDLRAARAEVDRLRASVADHEAFRAAMLAKVDVGAEVEQAAAVAGLRPNERAAIREAVRPLVTDKARLRGALSRAEAALASVRAQHKAERRAATQALIAEIGAAGPEDFEETAARAVTEIRRLRGELEKLGALKSGDSPHDNPDCPCGHKPGKQGPCAGCNCADQCPTCDKVGAACACAKGALLDDALAITWRSAVLALDAWGALCADNGADIAATVPQIERLRAGLTRMVAAGAPLMRTAVSDWGFVAGRGRRTGTVEAPKHPGKANTTWTILSVLEWVVARIDGKEG